LVHWEFPQRLEIDGGELIYLHIYSQQTSMAYSSIMKFNNPILLWKETSFLFYYASHPILSHFGMIIIYNKAV